MQDNHVRIRIALGVFALLSSSSDVWAAAAAQRMQQQKAMQQQAMQQQAAQQQAAQQTTQQNGTQQQATTAQQAAQQAAQQQQAQLQQMAAQQIAAAEYAAYKQAMQQVLASREAEAQSVAQMQQVVAERQAEAVAQYQQQAAYQQVQKVLGYKQSQAIQQAAVEKSQAEINGQIQEYANYLAKRKAAMGQQAIAQQQAQTAMEMTQYYERQKVAAVKNRMALQARAQEEVVRRRGGQQVGALAMAEGASQIAAREATSQAETVVTIEDLWSALDQGSLPWEKIIDTDIKRLTVAEYIDRFRKLGIKISRSPGEYVGIINTMAQQNAGFLKAPFLNVLSYAAIVEYDFDNGENKDELARKTLGEANFLANRKRLFGK